MASTSGPATRGLKLTVWQFVRIMVRLERDAGALYVAWRESWEEIDRSLTKLRADDAEGFAALMMDHEVSLDLAGRGAREELRQTLGRVIEEMRRDLDKLRNNNDLKKSLKFEIEELSGLRERLSDGPSRTAARRSRRLR